MKLTIEDKKYLCSIGHPESDFRQIEKALRKTVTKYQINGVEISREEAIRLLGRNEYLSGVGRSAFHTSAARKTDDGTIVMFDSDIG